MKFEIVTDEVKPDDPTLKTRLIVDGDGDLCWKVWYSSNWWTIAYISRDGKPKLPGGLPYDFPLPRSERGAIVFE